MKPKKVKKAPKVHSDPPIDLITGKVSAGESGGEITTGSSSEEDLS